MTTLVFLFLTRSHFTRTETIASILRRRYGEKISWEVCEFEKLDYVLRKVQLDSDFLCDVVIPDILNFRLANKILQDSVAYKKYQHVLLWGSCIGFAVCSWIQNLECSQQLKRIYICSKRLRKYVSLRFLLIKICGHTAEMAPILRLQLLQPIIGHNQPWKYC